MGEKGAVSKIYQYSKQLEWILTFLETQLNEGNISKVCYPAKARWNKNSFVLQNSKELKLDLPHSKNNEISQFFSSVY
ncbi:hypothetical protein O9992_09570 [Vibrio lentus]|nr:hypothetical protein [Vibrio lentus]